MPFWKLGLSLGIRRSDKEASHLAFAFPGAADSDRLPHRLILSEWQVVVIKGPGFEKRPEVDFGCKLGWGIDF